MKLQKLVLCAGIILSTSSISIYAERTFVNFFSYETYKDLVVTVLSGEDLAEMADCLFEPLQKISKNQITFSEFKENFINTSIPDNDFIIAVLDKEIHARCLGWLHVQKCNSSNIYFIKQCCNSSILVNNLSLSLLIYSNFQSIKINLYRLTEDVYGIPIGTAEISYSSVLNSLLNNAMLITYKLKMFIMKPTPGVLNRDDFLQAILDMSYIKSDLLFIYTFFVNNNCMQEYDPDSKRVQIAQLTKEFDSYYLPKVSALFKKMGIQPYLGQHLVKFT